MVEVSKIQSNDKDLFRLLLEFKDYAVIRISPDGCILSWNMGATHIYGFSFDEVQGKHLSLLYSNDHDFGKHRHQLLQTAAEEERCVEEGWKKRKDGTSFYAYTIVTVLYDNQHNIAGFAYVTRDISVKKRLEEENRLLREGLEQKVRQRTRELETVNHELEAFSYSVSHDLRTPLRAISGYAAILKEDHESTLDSEANRLINVILDNTKMMGNLIDDLLTFSRMARLVNVQESVNMEQLVEESLKIISGTKKLPSISIQALPPCQGDKNMLSQVWNNLLDNAVKYSSKNEAPHLTVGCLHEPGFHVYFIEDNGAGFDMKYSHKLFGVFQRLHRQDEFEGTGLGLALVKRIVGKHGGEVWVKAEVGKGATFFFSIPNDTHE